MVDRRHTDRDRRKVQRQVSTFAVKTTIGSRVELAQCEDIGPKGMKVRRPGGFPLTAGTPLRISFCLPGDRAVLSVQAQVVTDAGAGRFRRTGFQFARIAPEVAGRIAAFCGDGESSPLDSGLAADAAGA